MAKIIVVTSGKGGVGKTTSSASFSSGLAMRGHKTAVLDFDVGLRNLDLIMGCERRVVYDLINVINQEATLNQALIKDKHCDNLFILPASQTRDKDALSEEGVERVLQDLAKMDFDYIICDSPAGIEHGALMALTFADEAIVVTNPEVSSVRDSDRILGIIQAKSRRAMNGGEPVKEHLLITRYSPKRVEAGEMLSYGDVQEILRIPLVGIIPESESVLHASNQGNPAIHLKGTDVASAYEDLVSRFGGDEFVVLLTDLHDVRNAAVSMARQLLAAIGTPFEIEDQAFSLGASIGIALYDGAGLSTAQLMSQADSAMYAAKRAGKNKVRVFDSMLESLELQQA